MNETAQPESFSPFGEDRFHIRLTGRERAGSAAPNPFS